MMMQLSIDRHDPGLMKRLRSLASLLPTS